MARCLSTRFPLNADMWRPLERVTRRLASHRCRPARFRPAAVPETANQPPPTMDDFAADVALLLNRLQVNRATIGGLSMGGCVTFALFRKYPLRFTGIMADTKSRADTRKDARRR